MLEGLIAVSNNSCKAQAATNEAQAETNKVFTTMFEVDNRKVDNG